MKTTRSTLLCLIGGALILQISKGADPSAPTMKPHQPQCVVLTYHRPIGGYEVTVFWRPWERMAGYVIGPAILEFRNEDPYKTFAVTNDRFGLPDSAEWTKTATFADGYFASTTQPHAVLEYVEPDLTKGMPDANFFFADLNFDGEKELVLTETANGQRWRHSYRVQEPAYAGLKIHALESREPYRSLDSASKVDLQNRTIRIYNSGGAMNSQELLYKFEGKDWVLMAAQ